MSLLIGLLAVVGCAKPEAVADPSASRGRPLGFPCPAGTPVAATVPSYCDPDRWIEPIDPVSLAFALLQLPIRMKCAAIARPVP